MNSTLFRSLVCGFALFNLSLAFADSDDLTPFDLADEAYGEEYDVERAPIDARIPPPVRLPPIVNLCKNRPDLIVRQLPGPTWDHPRRQSIVPAVISNIGGAAVTRSFVVRFQDGSRVFETTVGGLAAGASQTVYMYPNYWVYDPDANYRVTVDATNQIQECNEVNNFMDFAGIG